MHVYSYQGRLAYVYTAPKPEGEHLPALMFLGGFKSDMMGAKALFLEECSKETGRAFMRFDYAGHGLSAGLFEEGTISAWTRDAQDILDIMPQKDIVLVGSSMGGWIALNLLLKNPIRVKAVIGIAAAPDFTQTIEPRMSLAQKEDMERNGFIAVPNNYGPEPYIYTRALIEDGRSNLLLDKTHKITVPLLLLQGKKDEAVAWQVAEKIKSCFNGPRTEVYFVEDGDHRLSRDEDLNKLKVLIESL